MKAKLSIGVLCDSLTPPGWVADILDDIARRPEFEVVLFVRNRHAPGLGERLRTRSLSAIIFALVNRLEARLSRLISQAPEADRARALEPRLREVACVDVEPQVSPSGLVHRFAPADCERVRAAGCDVILRFGFGILKGEILSCARHGIWSFHHGDNTVNRGGPPGFWEWYRDQPATGTILQILTEELDAGRVINRAQYRTCRISWNENRRRIFARSRDLLLDSLRGLAEDGTIKTLPQPPVYSQPLLLAPPVIGSLIAPGKLATRFVHAAFRRLFVHETWELAIGIIANDRAELRRFDRLVPPKGLFWADPFLIRRGGIDYVFAEEYEFGPAKGRVVCLAVEDGRLRERTVVMDTDAHFSYPFVFEHGGGLYMCPQDTAARGIELHRCTSFPAGWEPCGVLIPDVRATDTSIHRAGDRWWLLTNLCRNTIEDYGYELHLYWSADPLAGPWQAHPGNPVSQDARYARNGGGLVTLDGQLYRVAQGLTDVYGGKSQMMRVDRLDPDGYEESFYQEITPDWAPGLKGTHHFHASGGRAVVDALRYRFRFR